MDQWEILHVDLQFLDFALERCREPFAAQRREIPFSDWFLEANSAQPRQCRVVLEWKPEIVGGVSQTFGRTAYLQERTEADFEEPRQILAMGRVDIRSCD